MSPLSSKARVTPCTKSDCNVTFHDTDLVYLHFAHAHHRDDAPNPILNEALAKSLKMFLDQKKSQFKIPPRKMEAAEEIIVSCRDAACERTFASENLRDFHYNRMHHSRHPSMLSQLTETEEEEEQRRHGYECIKSDCDGRFLSPELRDFHCLRSHPMLWKATQDIYNSVITRPKVKDVEKQLLRADLALDLNNITPVTEMSESAFLSDVESDATSFCESDSDTKSNKPDSLAAYASKAEKEKSAIVEQVEVFVNVGSVEAPADPAVECEIEFLKIPREVELPRRQVTGYRSKSQMMMDRNALANPGASKWIVSCRAIYGAQP